MEFQDGDYVQIVGHMGKLVFTPSWPRVNGVWHRTRKDYVEIFTDIDVMEFIDDRRHMYDYIAVMREGDVIYG